MGVSMPKDEKPKWVVRTWDLNEDREQRARALQWVLNDIEEGGYEVRDINHENGYVVSIRQEDVKVEVPPESRTEEKTPTVPPVPKALQRLLERMGSRMAEVQVMKLSDLVAQKDDDEHPDAKGKRTVALMRGMCDVMENVSRGADKRSAELQIENVIKEVFQRKDGEGLRASQEDVQESIKDLERFTAIHAKDSETCDGNCPTQKVMKLSIAKLQEHLAANPAN